MTIITKKELQEIKEKKKEVKEEPKKRTSSVKPKGEE